MNREQETRGVVSDAEGGQDNTRESNAADPAENHDDNTSPHRPNPSQNPQQPPLIVGMNQQDHRESTTGGYHHHPHHPMGQFFPTGPPYPFSSVHASSHSPQGLPLGPFQAPPLPPQPQPQSQPVPGQQQILQYYEAQMRDHAAAYASAAAGAAWVAAQIAADMANASSVMMMGNHHHHPPQPPAPSSHPASSSSSMGGPTSHPSLVVPRLLPPVYHYGPTPTGFQPIVDPSGGGGGMAGYSSNANPTQGYMPPAAPAPPALDGGESAAASAPGGGGGGGMMPYVPTEVTVGYTSNYGDEGEFVSQSFHQPYQQEHHSNYYQQQPQFFQQRHYEHHGQQKRRKRQQQQQQQQQQYTYQQQQQQQHPHPTQGGSSWASPSNGINNSKRRATWIRKSMTSSNSSDGGNSATSHLNKKKKARQPNVDSLLGKTGISAIFEWCDKRRMTTPTFNLLPSEGSNDNSSSKLGISDGPSDDEKKSPSEFDMSVTIDGIEWGRGRARTKTAAKQEAARRALQALIPGIVFDEVTGFLIELPPTLDEDNGYVEADASSSHALWKASTSLEDLAPNLAKRLAIASKEDSKLESGRHVSDYSKKRPSKWQGGYPSTTTSEEEDENTYYASRGASVCSALLHAMVQIDDRIPEGPNYSYEIPSKGDAVVPVATRPIGMGVVSSVSRRSPLLIHRGPFTCIASMRLRQPRTDGEAEPKYELLKAVGVAGAKREAKHSASAKLLALLFPECDGMAQVKEAAEAARERYAASKALKYEEAKRVRQRSLRLTQPKEAVSSKFRFAMGSSLEPVLPLYVENHLLHGVKGWGEAANEESANQARRQSRYKQWKQRVNTALQKLNECDEEGRSLPEDELLTVDDVVGRTVLRRATPDDYHWISRLLGDDLAPNGPLSVLRNQSGISDDASQDHVLSGASMWSLSSVILLLCRAIAPYDDPPLGCAVLTMGFSMEKGRTLVVSQIGRKPHLPRERFMECLQAFAGCMKCALDGGGRELSVVKRKTSSKLRIGHSDVQRIFHSHLSDPERVDVENASGLLAVSVNQKGEREDKSTPEIPTSHDLPPSLQPRLQNESSSYAQVDSSLQSVLEESEGVDESGAESGTDKRGSRKKKQDKPSKRSRVH